ncbi:MAG: MFS transporter [Terrimesophilobacter sp.]
MTSTPERPFSLRSVALAAFLPTLVFAIGEGAIIPIIPVVAHNLGATLAVAGFIAAMIMVGELLGDIPSGWIVSRIGERTAMIGASFLSIAGLITAMVAPNPWLLAFGILLVGLATAVFALARHAFMTSYVPVAYRARALSSLGGTFRFGYFIGPFISAAVIHLTGTSQSVFWIHIGACLAAAGILLLLPDPAATFGTPHGRSGAGGRLMARQAQGLFSTIWISRGVLVKLGGGAALIGALRASRQVILPLWAVSIGISDTNTALIIGVAGGVDFALFYASGQIMDRFGRMWTSVPSMLGLGAGHIILAFTHDAPGRVLWFIGVAILLSLANGIGSGLLMTLGADLADKDDPAPFLGAWRFTSDAGSAAAPLAVSLITALASVAIASSIMGVFGLLGAGILARYLPRYLPRRPARR